MTEEDEKKKRYFAWELICPDEENQMGFKREIMFIWRDIPCLHAHIYKHFLILSTILCAQE